MHALYLLLFGAIPIFVSASGLVQGTVKPLCSCINPVGVCALLCMRRDGKKLPNFSIGQNVTSPYIKRPFLPSGLAGLRQWSFPQRIMAQPAMMPQAPCETETVTQTITYTQVRTHLSLLPVTKFKTVKESASLKETPAPLASILLKTVDHTSMVHDTKTVFVTNTLPPVTQYLTKQSVQVLTPLPTTVVKEIRVPPSIFVSTQLVPVTSISILTSTVTRFSVSVVTATPTPSMDNTYINVQPLPDKKPGVLIEFHDSNQTVKRVRVVSPINLSPESAPFRESQPEALGAAGPSVPLPAPAPGPAAKTRFKTLLITSVKYFTKTKTVTSILATTNIKTKTLTNTQTNTRTTTALSIRPVTSIKLVEHTKNVTSTVTEKQVSTQTVQKTVTVTAHPTPSTSIKTVTIHKTKPVTISSITTKTKPVVSTKTIYITTVKPTYITQAVTKKAVTSMVTVTKVKTKPVTITQQKPALSTASSNNETVLRQIISDLRTKVDHYQELVHQGEERARIGDEQIDRLSTLLSKQVQ
ncbi:hypothetical protein NEDG_01924 [Nematocida displodere]|uniref:Uncharacterized protein n=1 Tax=Nematocida displodere TaxID=1805483 RepID=A0A177EHH7_9MICR|nr:hypothetical protein NEDG_01924 [Nematocida displodere]